MSVIKKMKNEREKSATAMIEIQNNQQCFVQLWLRLERTRRLFQAQNKRFCIRSILKYWFGSEADDDFIWEVCHRASLLLVKGYDEDSKPVYGWDELPPPKLYPRKHRELLRVLVAVSLGIGMRKVKLKDLDKAYSIAFPNATPINISKKTHPRGRRGIEEKEGTKTERTERTKGKRERE